MFRYRIKKNPLFQTQTTTEKQQKNKQTKNDLVLIGFKISINIINITNQLYSYM